MLRSELRELLVLLLLLRSQRSRDLRDDSRLEGVSYASVRKALEELHHYHGLVNRDEHGFYYVVDECDAIRAIGDFNKYSEKLTSSEYNYLVRVVRKCEIVSHNPNRYLTINNNKETLSPINNDIISRGLSLAESILERRLDEAERELLGTLLYHYDKTGQKWLDPRELEEERIRYRKAAGESVVVVTPVEKLVEAARRLHGYGITYIYHRGYTQKIGLLKQYVDRLVVEVAAR